MGARKRREPLSRDRALAAAIALVDAEGMPALTMRRLAADLGVEAMSLYHHLPGKEGLLDGLVDAVVAEIATVATQAETAAAGGDWRTRLRLRFLAARTVMLRHPWAPALLTARSTIPAGVYGYYEGILATLIDGGFSYRIAHRALHAFGSLALGFAQEVFQPGAGEEVDAEAAEAELAELSARLPHLAAMVAAELHDATDPTLGWCDSQTEFEFTLDLLFDGLEQARDAAGPAHRETPALPL
ncbi:TetR/AcrR family transcriptional regulator C-terminal domain-containing protein [Verrucosispora sp. WMMA2044]|uniref:TetR family transcriptional regulator n=1 Tax=Verrucosispora sioxanthis TaxID=2499994 RepID=A0A6M1L3U8_9ACTN|nr:MULTISPECIES: TetR/AcrR family transcriptional regulator C-terminal domain-containing protein [Micromonospora]NEE63610.1 TetR family transcriptional regulator [Verrucosispora sioxanthis]NGM12720.1 TetR family transcriptional regulator [Verrucosispora sioxanthis]WBB48087.1 TetR/AcrR family transcriptional regulator C-terminal domain-containing protein [Verrucosispora sp. WMMA2044]